MAGVTVTLTGDSAKLWSEIEKVVSAQKRMEGGLAEITRQSDAAAKKARELEQAAMRVYEGTRTHQEKHAAQLTKLNELLKAGKISHETYGRAVKQSADEMNKAEASGTAAFGPKLVSMLKGAAGALGLGAGLAGVLQLVNKELEVAEQRAERARAASMSMADAQIVALRNLGATTKGERDDFIARIQAMSKETGVSEKDLYLRAADSLSAKGALSVDQALSAVRASTQIAPESADVGRTVSGAILDLKKFMPNWSSEELAGFLAQSGIAARAPDIKRTAPNLAKVLASGAATGADPRSSAALWAAITTTASDDTGELSRTAAIQAMSQLADFLPEKDTYDYPEGGEKKLKRAGTGLRTFDQRLAYLRANPEAMDEFLSKFTAEAGAKKQVMEIIRGEGAPGESYAQFRRTLPDQAEAGAFYPKYVETLTGGELQQTARFGRAMSSSVERLRSGNTYEARVGIARDDFKQILQDAGEGWATSSMSDLSVKVSRDKLAATIEQIEKRKAFLDAPTEKVAETTWSGFSSTVTYRDRARPQTASEKNAAAAFADMLKELKAIREQMEKEKAPTPAKATQGTPMRDQ